MPGWTLLVIPIGAGCAAIIALALAAFSVRIVRRLFQPVSAEPCAASVAQVPDEQSAREALRTRVHGQIAVRHVQIEPLDEQGLPET